MKNSNKLMWVMALVCVAIGGAAFFSYIGYSNTEVELRNQVEAQKQVLESHHDRMWSTLAQQAQVSDQYREVFEEVYPALMEGRYSANEAAGMLNINVVTEDNPEFDTSLYRELSRTIESERTSFHRTQSRLIDLHREHKSLVQTFPGSLMLAGRDDVEITIISSTRSRQAAETGIDDDRELF